MSVLIIPQSSKFLLGSVTMIKAVTQQTRSRYNWSLETEFRRMISEQQAARAGTNQQVDHLLHWKDQFNRGLQAVWREISLLSNLLKVTATIKKSSKPFIRGCT
eukprot:TRINITY_DN68068_c3_g1_i4.p2 TRINITY_DN68068_c3_g1~~TRINITY_DN68068_c3_g1_i4.p2  ORF type:complete len:104 (-),score=11.13 TRINITY_DN68068_c3_g1_i4:23-334(-)